jgi:hypothetical protein
MLGVLLHFRRRAFLSLSLMNITRKSPISGIERTLDLPITQEQIDSWENGELIQVALPDLTANQREFLLTGIVQDEWDALFKEYDGIAGVIEFEYNNAYDVYSANALNELGDIITKQEMAEPNCILHCTDLAQVLEVMDEYGFTYHIRPV